MIARVTTFKGDPARAASPDFLSFMERAVPEVKKQPGFKGLYFLAERNTGEGLAITLWETEQQAEAMGQGPLVQLREEAARQVGAAAAPPGKNYEVVIQA
jgi:heme-degrading monooxygenase HmoA